MPFLRWVICIYLALAYLWGLRFYGAAEVDQMYRLSLLFVPGTGVLLAGLFGRSVWRGRAMLFVLAVGLFLGLNVVFRATPMALGYTHFLLGWNAFLISLLICGESRKWARRLFIFLILVGALEAVYGLAQSIGGYDAIGDYQRRLGRIATGTLINRNHFAGLLNMTIPLALGGLFASFGARYSRRYRSESLSQAWLILVGCALMSLVILLTQSRGGTLSLLLSLCLMGLLLNWHKKHRRQPAVTALAMAVLLLLLVGLGFWVGLEGLFSRVIERQSGLQGRAEIYKDTLGLIADNPILGVGPRMYQWRFRPYQTTEAQVWVDYAHNDYLQTATEWGLPLALLFWGFVVRTFLSGVSTFLSSRDPWRQGMALGGVVAVFSILLHSLVDFNLYIPTNLMLFCAILGLLFAMSRPGQEGEGVA